MRTRSQTSNSNRRYELLPQTRVYERMRLVWVPHTMYVHEPNLRSDVCNTDEHGFRYTICNGSELDYAAFQRMPGKKGLLCGGSAAFGVGATSDKNTIASFLNQEGDTTWFNFAGISYNSTQELLRFLLFLPKVDRVVLFTGINNLNIHFLSALFSDVYGSMFSYSTFDLLNRVANDRQYLRYIVGRIRVRLADRLRRLIPGSSSLHDEPDYPDFPNRYEKSLNILSRDLQVWSALRDRLGFSLDFVLQPIAVWMPKEFSSQEDELINVLDAAGRRQWGRRGGALQRHLTTVYPQYREDTKQLCDQSGIPWTDCNELLPRQGWLFCDRTHLTDEGYRLAADALRPIVCESAA